MKPSTSASLTDRERTHLLNSPTLGLLEHVVGESKVADLYSQVYRVVLPLNSFQCDGVDVLVEGEGYSLGHDVNRHSLGTDGVREDFRDVEIGEDRP